MKVCLVENFFLFLLFCSVFFLKILFILLMVYDRIFDRGRIVSGWNGVFIKCLVFFEYIIFFICEKIKFNKNI